MTMTTTADHEAKRTALAASAFGALSDTQLDDVARVSDLRHAAAGDTVCVQGEFALTSFVVAAGMASVRVDGVDVALARRGDIVGDWALFRGGSRSATVTAVTPLTLVVVDPRELDSLLAAVPSAASVIGPKAVR